MAVCVAASSNLLHDLHALDELALLVAAMGRSADRGGNQRQSTQREDETHDDSPYLGAEALIMFPISMARNRFRLACWSWDSSHRQSDCIAHRDATKWLFEDDRIRHRPSHVVGNAHDIDDRDRPGRTDRSNGFDARFRPHPAISCDQVRTFLRRQGDCYGTRRRAGHGVKAKVTEFIGDLHPENLVVFNY